ncbi:MAG: GNAT family N-acetyltransferase [Candidatus Nanohalobium sp.]
MPGNVFLEGENVHLRTVEKDDIEFLRDGVNHPDVRVHMLNRRPQNLEDEEEFFQDVIRDEDDVHLLICRGEEPMGIISLNQHSEESKVAEIGIWLHPNYHGNGYGTEASSIMTDYGFNQLNYHKIYARAHSENEASQSIWRKLGFEQEGRLREHVYTEGEYRDAVYFGKLKGEHRDE